MHLHRHFAASLSFFTVLAALASSAPTTQSAFSHLPDAAAHDLSTATLLQQPSNNNSGSITGPQVAQRVNNTSDSSISEFGPSSATNLSTTGEVTYWAGTWDISSTLSLNINIGQWRLSPEKVLATLEAAENAVGKKEAAALVEGNFTQKTGSRLNTMIFEIGPVPEEEGRLNWKDVADMLEEERGLPRFFRETKEWHNLFFELVHSERGLLGLGSIAKWYMLDYEGNGTGLETV